MGRVAIFDALSFLFFDRGTATLQNEILTSVEM